MSRILTALLVSPDPALRAQAAAALSVARYFEMLAEIREYCPPQTLQLRVRQMQPDVILLDVGTDATAAEALLRDMLRAHPSTQVIALTAHSDPAGVVYWLRSGAADVLAAPFAVESQHEIAARICRVRQPAQGQTREAGKVAAFSSAKPGAGASTLALETARAVAADASSSKVLLIDLTSFNGMLPDGGRNTGSSGWAEAPFEVDPGALGPFLARRDGFDILPAGGPVLDFHRLRELLHITRNLYSWVLVDLPPVFRRVSLFAFSEADVVFVLCTPDLPSLHLARRASSLLRDLGLDLGRNHFLLNRVNPRGGFGAGEIDKLLGRPILHAFPVAPDSVLACPSDIPPAPPQGDFGKALRAFTGKLETLVSDK